MSLDSRISAAVVAASSPIHPKVRMTVAQVENLQQISPNFRRLRLQGDFSAFLSGGLHFRFMIGPEGASLPTQDETGLNWPGGAQSWHRPAYTIRAMDRDLRWIDVDIFLHEGGRVTQWTETLQGGEVVGLTGPGGSGVSHAGWQGMVGDETALPVILRMIEALPQNAQGQAFIRVPDLADVQEVATPARYRLTWVTNRDLLSVLDQLNPVAGNRFLFFAGEKREAARAREWFTARGIDKAESRAAAYWINGPYESQ